jgi:hypothetical protein
MSSHNLTLEAWQGYFYPRPALPTLSQKGQSMARQPAQRADTTQPAQHIPDEAPTDMRDTAAQAIADKANEAEGTNGAANEARDTNGAAGQGAEATGHAPAGTSVAVFQMPAIRIKKRVTVPNLTFPDGSKLVCKIVRAIYKGKEMAEGARGPIQKAADLTHIEVITEAGHLATRTLVVGEVLKSEIVDAFPDETYVGKWFYLEKFAPNQAKQKKYATYAISEIDDPTEGMNLIHE